MYACKDCAPFVYLVIGWAPQSSSIFQEVSLGKMSVATFTVTFMQIGAVGAMEGLAVVGAPVGETDH